MNANSNLPLRLPALFLPALLLLLFATGCVREPELFNNWQMERFRVLLNTAPDNPGTQAEVAGIRDRMEELIALRDLGADRSYLEAALRDEEITRLDREINLVQYIPVEEFLEEGSEITLAFTPDDGARGNAGCNDYEAGFTVLADGTMLFEGLQVGSKVCMVPTGVMTQELNFFRILSETDSYEIKDGRLTLNSDREGLIFRPAE